MENIVEKELEVKELDIIGDAGKKRRGIKKSDVGTTNDKFP